MKIRFFLALAAVFTAFGFSVASNFQTARGASFAAFGAKCKVNPFDIAYRQSSAVFMGEISDEEKVGDFRIFKFKVEKYWKGSIKEKTEVFVYETTRFQSWFKKGGKYLVYANANENGKLSVSKCSRSRSVESSEEDLKKLGKGKTPR